MYSELLYEGSLKGYLKSHLSRPSSFAIVLGHKLGKLNEGMRVLLKQLLGCWWG